MRDAMNDTVSYESSDRIATITINRPEKMNALNEEVIQGLRDAWIRFADSYLGAGEGAGLESPRDGH